MSLDAKALKALDQWPRPKLTERAWAELLDLAERGLLVEETRLDPARVRQLRDAMLARGLVTPVQAAVAAERERIVAWLRNRADEHVAWPEREAIQDAADAIERGAHARAEGK